MRIQQISPQVLLIRNNDWSRDWISPAFFVFLAGLWHFLFYPLIFENDDPLVYYLTHSLLIVLLLLNWPITESVTLDKSKNTITLKRKLLLKPTEYSTTLTGAKAIKEEKYKGKLRFAISFADGMNFPLSTAYFPERLVPDSIKDDIRVFLGFKLKKQKNPKDSNKNNTTSSSLSSNKTQNSVPAKQEEDSDSSLDFSDSELQNDLDWDKAIDDWEAEVKERRTFHS